MIRVHAASYQAISILHGGPNTQLRNTMKHLHRFGVDAKLFDPWSPFSRADSDIVHLFAANVGTYHLAHELHTLGIPLVTSPIFFRMQSPQLLRAALAGTRIVQKVAKGFWSDVALTADICNWSVHLTPNSQAEAELVARSMGVPLEKMTVIPNGVDARFHDADPSLFKNHYGIEKFILNVGHIGPARKNVLTLIKALATVDHPAVIIGRIIPGKDGAACVAEAKRHKHILLIDGLQNDSDMLASAYAAADTFVLPSLFETPGIAALEAGLAGAKVVITPHGGTREYFGNMATYVDPYSVDAIRTGIITTLQQQKDDRLRNHIRREFLWERVAEKTADVYKKVLRGTLQEKK
jgi:glycosyltransferase involved in cell wall biosynthesis